MLGLVVVAALMSSNLTDVPDPSAIVGGSPVATCGWPTTVSTSGCTATLVHPQAVSTAQHCGPPSSIQFGPAVGQGPTVAVTSCVGDGSQDAMLCALAEPVTEVPVTPVLFGCEADTYLQVGQPVVIAGFGQTSFGSGGGTKLWAPQSIASVEAGRVIVGQAGDGTSPCPGDSGGPVFVRVEDGTWRVFGTVLGGTTGTPCNSAADFQRIDVVVPAFEAQTGIDITPCFDGQTGAWEPGPECGGFFSGDHSHEGSWDDWCGDIPAGGYSATCGSPFGDDGTSTTGDDGGSSTGDDGGEPTGGGAGTGSDGGVEATSGDENPETRGGDASGGGQGPTGTATGGAGALPGTGSGSTSAGCRIGDGAGVPSAWWMLFALVAIRRRDR